MLNRISMMINRWLC